MGVNNNVLHGLSCLVFCIFIKPTVIFLVYFAKETPKVFCSSVSLHFGKNVANTVLIIDRVVVLCIYVCVIFHVNFSTKTHPRRLINNTMLNSSPSSAAYMRQWTRLALLQVMARRLFGAKPLSKPMLAYCHLVSWEQFSVKFESEFCHLH